MHTDSLMSKSILPMLRERLAHLSRAEAQVARMMLADPGAFAGMAIADVALRAEVSEPTVIRFCRSMGCNGWPDFKIRLAASMMAGTPYVHASLSASDGTAELIRKVFDNASSALQCAAQDLAPASVDTAIEALAHARRIEFYGAGNSGIVAADAQHKFFRLDLNTVAYSDPHIQLMAASLLGPQDVLVAISHSGRSRGLLDAVRLAHSNACPILAITTADTPLAELADILLEANTQEDTEIYSPMLSRMVHLALIDTLALGVAFKLSSGTLLEKTKRSLRSQRQ